MDGSIYDIPIVANDGSTQTLADYRGRVLLVVNVASRCGFTPQYSGLERLYRTHKDRGLVVLGFPCDQFGHQEPGTDAEIRTFCTRQYDVTFPLFSKIKVNGPDAHPLYQRLKSDRKGMLGSGAIKWNFTKFLVDRRGSILARYGPRDAPESLEPDIVRALDAPPTG
jgi:glutathione peroxidase